MCPVIEKRADKSPRWNNLGNWVHAICVVTFDLEVGQAMELVYPSHQELTERDRNNICYLAFPDSNSGLMGDVQFHFRIPISKDSANELTSRQEEYNEMCPVTCQAEIDYMYGYVYFRQVKDRSLRRGYFQKSVVLLSKLPLLSFFTSVMDLIAPEYFDIGEPSLEAICQHIDQWSPPIPGDNLVLPLMGTLFKIRIPCKQDNPAASLLQPANTEISTSPTLVIPYPHEIQAFPVLAPILPYVNLLWELVIVAEPLVVITTSPAAASNMVHVLISLISPLKFSGDFRPFFTIHDCEFKEYTARTTAPPNVILGVTNPFFAKTLQHWPHIIRISETTSMNQTKLSKWKSMKVFDHNPGVYTNFKPFLNPDKNLIKRLLKGIEIGRPVEAQSALLKRHFLELTQSFMIPLERYVASLMPLQKNISPFKSAPVIRPFNPDEFFATLDTSGPQLTSGIKGNWEGLYRRFFRSTNFSSWFNSRYNEVSHKLTLLHIQSLGEANLNSWLPNRCEVEIVDFLLRLRSNLSTARSACAPDSAVRKLCSQIQRLLDALPSDLRSVLQKS